jgi:hypothetical protein
VVLHVQVVLVLAAQLDLAAQLALAGQVAPQETKETPAPQAQLVSSSLSAYSQPL